MMIGGRLDTFFEDLYRRLEGRYLAVMRWTVVVPIYVGAAAFAAVFLGYLDATATQIARVLVVGHVLFALAVLLYQAPRGKQLCEPIDQWVADGRPRERLTELWVAASTMTIEGFWVSLRMALGLYVVLMVYASIEFSLGLAEIATITHGFTLAVIGIVAVTWPYAEVYHRPVRRDLARRMGDALPDVKVRFPMGGRLLLTGAAIGVTNGAVIAYAARINAPLADLGRLGLLVTLSGVVISALPIFLLARWLLAPIEDLLAATRRVRDGDLTARADVTTNDEIGVLAHSFNEMLQRLERAVDEVQKSRARIVAASDAERKRVERNIHDGAQQQLTALSLQLEMLKEQAADDPSLLAGLQLASQQLRASLDELRELARGLHPSVLSTDGLRPALENLVERSPLPVQLSAPDTRFGDIAESTVYFVAAEALANVVKYSQASQAWIEVQGRDDQVTVEVGDDGIGGAHLGDGSGLPGLLDRVEAVGGSLSIDSEPGEGTTITVALPVGPIAGGVA